MSSPDSFNLVQITDTHIFGSPDKMLAGTNTRDTLLTVLTKVSEIKNVSRLIVTGDVSMDGSQNSYDWISKQLEATGMDFSVLPGNHDDIQKWPLVFPQHLCSFPATLIEKPWKLIFLNTQILGREYGGIDHKSLSFLKKEMNARDAAFIVIFMHHPPFSVGSNWIDAIGLKAGKEEFLELISGTKVKLVVSGHVHQEASLKFGSTEFVTTPSTCVQFLSNSYDFALDAASPGYRIISLFEDGRVETSVSRLN